MSADPATATVPRRASPIDVVASGEPRRRRTEKTAERVAGEIVRDIVARELGSGAHLPLEAAMATQYRVSRSSVREALRILEVQGLISLKPGPGGGPVVGVVEATNLARTESLYFHLAGATYRDLIATQAVLEPLCAAAAAVNPARRAAMAPYVGGGALDDVERYHRDTLAFHRAIYELAANPVLRLLTEAITQLVTSHVLASSDPVELHADIVAEHADIAAAVAEGDAAAAHRLTAEHFAAQHDFYRRNTPARLSQLIEWR
jgi:GntR family transcriptional regulator, transcriptional repressor for pyruvate dehydrogenase complex